MRSVLLLLALLPGAAVAEGLADTHFRMNFCYQQAFTAADLSANPDQKVRQIMLGRKPVGVTEHLGEVTMQVVIMLRDGSNALERVARCSPNAEGLSCGLGHGGGRFELTAQDDGVALTTTGPNGMVFEGRTEDLRVGADDGVDQSFALRPCG